MGGGVAGGLWRHHTGRHLGFSKKKTREFIVGFTSKMTHK